MSDPWSILGWLFVGALILALSLFIVVLAVFAFFAAKLWYREAYLPWSRYRKTRNVKPAKGQIWGQRNGANLRIKYIVPDSGRIVIKSGCASWSDSPEDWKRRVESRSCFLINSGEE